MLSCKICEIFKNFWCDEAIASLIKFKFNFALFTSIKFHKLVENYVISFLGLGPATREITGKFIETVKWKNCKVHVKKTATLLNIYYFTLFFKEFHLVLNNSMLLFIKTGVFQKQPFANVLQNRCS